MLVETLPFDGGLRFHEVRGDNMEPTVRCRDYVLAAPIDRYVGEGYYLVSFTNGHEALYACCAGGTYRAPLIKLYSHNKFYSSQELTIDAFRRVVVGKIAMTCKIQDDTLIRSRYRAA